MPLSEDVAAIRHAFDRRAPAYDENVRNTAPFGSAEAMQETGLQNGFELCRHAFWRGESDTVLLSELRMH